MAEGMNCATDNLTIAATHESDLLHLYGTELYCGWCLRSFRCPTRLKFHFYIEHQPTCPCGASFENKNGLLSHVIDHRCVLPPPFKWEHFVEDFELSTLNITSVAVLDQPLKRAKIKPLLQTFACQRCGRCFGSVYGREEHKPNCRELKFCPAEESESSFLERRCLRGLAVCHQGQLNCLICPFTASLHRKMNRHIRTEHEYDLKAAIGKMADRIDTASVSLDISGSSDEDCSVAKVIPSLSEKQANKVKAVQADDFENRSENGSEDEKRRSKNMTEITCIRSMIRQRSNNKLACKYCRFVAHKFPSSNMFRHIRGVHGVVLKQLMIKQGSKADIFRDKNAASAASSRNVDSLQLAGSSTSLMESGGDFSGRLSLQEHKQANDDVSGGQNAAENRFIRSCITSLKGGLLRCRLCSIAYARFQPAAMHVRVAHAAELESWQKTHGENDAARNSRTAKATTVGDVSDSENQSSDSPSRKDWNSPVRMQAVAELQSPRSLRRQSTGAEGIQLQIGVYVSATAGGRELELSTTPNEIRLGRRPEIHSEMDDSELHECRKCSRKFSSARALKRHTLCCVTEVNELIVSVPSSGRFKCKLCSVSYAYYRDTKRHLIQQHPGSVSARSNSVRPKCDESKKCASPPKCKVEESPSVADTRRELYLSASPNKNQLRRLPGTPRGAHDAQLHQCRNCYKKFRTVQAVKCHVLHCIGGVRELIVSTSGGWKCKLCGASFTRRRDNQYSHFKNEHPTLFDRADQASMRSDGKCESQADLKAEDSPGSADTCSELKLSTSPDGVQLRRLPEIRRETVDAGLLVCSTCCRQFSTVQAVTSHRRFCNTVLSKLIINDLALGRFKCKLCGQSYMQYGGVKYHLRREHPVAFARSKHVKSDDRKKGESQTGRKVKDSVSSGDTCRGSDSDDLTSPIAQSEITTGSEQMMSSADVVLDDYRLHAVESNTRHTESFQCLYCPLKFKSSLALSHHDKHKHERKKASPVRLKPEQESYMKTQLIKKLSAKRMGCVLCNRTFIHYYHAKFHLKTVHKVFASPDKKLDKCASDKDEQLVIGPVFGCDSSAIPPAGVGTKSSLKRNYRRRNKHELARLCSFVGKNEGRFVCSICQVTFATNFSAVKHIRCKHPDVVHPAKQSSAVLVPDNERLRSKDGRTVLGTVGGEGCSTLLGPVAAKFSLKRTFPCTRCSKSFRSSGALQFHIRHHPHNKDEVAKIRSLIAKNEDDGLFVCSVCKVTFNTRKCVQKHVRRRHQDAYQSKQHSSGSGHCELDEQASVPDRNRTSAAHTFRCRRCPKTFCSASQLLFHLRHHPRNECELAKIRSLIVKNENENRFGCSLCQLKFGSHNAAQRHIRCKHPDAYYQEKQHSLGSGNCELDGQASGHDLTPESEQRDITNSVPARDRTSAARTFRCRRCPRTYRSASELFFHLRHHPRNEHELAKIRSLIVKNENESGFVCSLCQAKFDRHTHAQQHIRRKHPDAYRQAKKHTSGSGLDEPESDQDLTENEQRDLRHSVPARDHTSATGTARRRNRPEIAKIRSLIVKNENEGSFMCSVCQVPFVVFRYAQSHVRRSHMDIVRQVKLQPPGPERSEPECSSPAENQSSYSSRSPKKPGGLKAAVKVAYKPGRGLKTSSRSTLLQRCKYCNEVFAGQRSLRRHMVLCQLPKEEQCRVRSLVVSIYNRGRLPQHTCKLCSKTFTERRASFSHVIFEHGYACKTSQQVSKTGKDNADVKNQSPVKNEREFTELSKIDTSVPEAAVSGSSVVSKIRALQSKQTAFKCTRCGRNYRFKHTLDFHSRFCGVLAEGRQHVRPYIVQDVVRSSGAKHFRCKLCRGLTFSDFRYGFEHFIRAHKKLCKAVKSTTGVVAKVATSMSVDDSSLAETSIHSVVPKVERRDADDVSQSTDTETAESFGCSHCRQSFSTVKKLHWHAVSHITLEQRNRVRLLSESKVIRLANSTHRSGYECKMCRKSMMSDFRLLYSHMAQSHPESLKQAIDSATSLPANNKETDSQAEISDCSEVKDIRADIGNVGQNQDAKRKGVSCSSCGGTFSTMFKLHWHAVVHLTAEERNYVKSLAKCKTIRSTNGYHTEYKCKMCRKMTAASDFRLLYCHLMQNHSYSLKHLGNDVDGVQVTNQDLTAEPSTVTCQKCSKVFSKPYMPRHRVLCDLSAADRLWVTSQVRLVKSPAGVVHSCKRCRKMFRLLVDAERHVVRMHRRSSGASMSDVVAEPESKCDSPLRGDKTDAGLCCSHCQRRFATVTKLHHHAIVHLTPEQRNHAKSLVERKVSRSVYSSCRHSRYTCKLCRRVMGNFGTFYSHLVKSHSDLLQPADSDLCKADRSAASPVPADDNDDNSVAESSIHSEVPGGSQDGADEFGLKLDAERKDRLRCSLCRRKFGCPGALRQHIFAHLTPEQRNHAKSLAEHKVCRLADGSRRYHEWKCKLCRKVMCDFRVLYSHLEQSHPNSLKQPCEDGVKMESVSVLEPCSVAQLGKVTEKSSELSHTAAAPEQNHPAQSRTLSCHQCSMVFSHLKTLRRHQMTACLLTAVERLWLSSQLCFAKSSAGRSYSCKHCHKAFGHITSARMHVLIHHKTPGMSKGVSGSYNVGSVRSSEVSSKRLQSSMTSVSKQSSMKKPCIDEESDVTLQSPTKSISKQNCAKKPRIDDKSNAKLPSPTKGLSKQDSVKKPCVDDSALQALVVKVMPNEFNCSLCGREYTCERHVLKHLRTRHAPTVAKFAAKSAAIINLHPETGDVKADQEAATLVSAAETVKQEADGIETNNGSLVRDRDTRSVDLETEGKDSDVTVTAEFSADTLKSGTVNETSATDETGDPGVSCDLEMSCVTDKDDSIHSSPTEDNEQAAVETAKPIDPNTVESTAEGMMAEVPTENDMSAGSSSQAAADSNEVCYPCFKCWQSFGTKSQYLLHKRLGSLKCTKDSRSGDGNSDKRSFNLLLVNAYAKSMCHHIGEGGTQCTICGMIFNQMSVAQKHVRLSHGVPTDVKRLKACATRQPVFRHCCTMCTHSYPKRSELERHVRRIHELKRRSDSVFAAYYEVLSNGRHQCSLCDSNYLQHGDMLKHLRKKHEIRAKPYRPRPNLTAFADKYVVLSNGKHKCRICGYVNALRRGMYQHLRTSHGAGNVFSGNDRSVEQTHPDESCTPSIEPEIE